MNELQEAIDIISERIKKIEMEKKDANNDTDLALLIGNQGGLIDAEKIILDIIYKKKIKS